MLEQTVERDRVFAKLLLGLFLMGLCVTIHAAGLTGALRWLRQRAHRTQPFLPVTWLFILIAAWMVLLHLFEISVWAAFYFWLGAVADLASAFYFSAVTYTTTGYGDIVLPEDWRLVGGIESLAGILLCGWSTGFFFAVVNRLYEPRAAR